AAGRAAQPVRAPARGPAVRLRPHRPVTVRADGGAAGGPPRGRRRQRGHGGAADGAGPAVLVTSGGRPGPGPAARVRRSEVSDDRRLGRLGTWVPDGPGASRPVTDGSGGMCGSPILTGS